MNFDAIAITFSYIARFILLASVFVIAVNWQKFARPFHFFLWYVILNLIVELVAGVYFELSKNNLPILHLFTFLEFVLLSSFYKPLLRDFGLSVRLFFLITISVALLIVLNTLFLQPIFEFNSYAKSLSQTILIAYAVWYFFGKTIWAKKSTGNNDLDLINAALLIYFSGSLFIFMFSNTFAGDETGAYSFFWALNALLNVLYQVLIFIGLWRVAYSKVILCSS